MASSESALQQKRGDALYICGAPGTGKTVSVEHVLVELFGADRAGFEAGADSDSNSRANRSPASGVGNAKLIRINAMDLSEPRLFFHKV